MAIEINPPRSHGFWDTLPRPVYVLAPMADVTDAAYRRLIARLGKPDVMFTEFVSCDGLCSDGRKNLLIDLEYDPSERPIVAQIFGSNQEHVRRTGELVRELGFDGIDINMGCPDRNVCKQGAGAALIRNPELAKEIVRAAREGGSGLPVSVKTRIGYNSVATSEWVGHLLETRPAAITLHLRTRKEMSKVEARWDQISEAIALAEGTGTLILGNGDVRSLKQADELVARTGVDGIMLGRAIFGNPWLFNREKSPDRISIEERFAVMVEHARLYEKLFAGRKRFVIMRKHLRSYLAGYPGAREFRMMLESIDCAADLERAMEALREALTGPIMDNSAR